MEHAIVELAKAAAWLFFIGFIFAVIGVIATIRWIVYLFTRTEEAVETGVHDAESRFH